MVRTLDPCLKRSGFETTFRPVIKYEERISQLSVIPGEKAKGIMRCGHIDRKDQGRTARLVTYSVVPLCLAHQPIHCGDSERICLSTMIINYQQIYDWNA